MVIFFPFFQDDFVVSAPRKHKLKEHDQLLKKFEYSKALDSVLRKVGLYNAIPATAKYV